MYFVENQKKNQPKSHRLNVLICAYCVDKNDVGEAQMAYKWISKLAESTNLWIITTGSRLHQICGFEDHENVELITLKPNISFKWLDSFDRAVHPGYVEFFFRARKAAKKLVEQQRIDLCHHLAPRSLRYPSPFIGIGVPFIVGPFHGGLKAPPIMKELEVKDNWMFKMRVIDTLRIRYDPLLRKHYSKAKRLVVSAPYVRDLLLSENRGKCVVIPPPPSFEFDENSFANIKLSKGNDVLRLMYVGRLVPSKGLELLILAMSKCKNINLKLIIYGCGYREACYRRIAERLNVGNRIIWKGFVPNSEVVKAYADADVFTFPSLKEPTGIALTEAMANGLPIVCVDAGGSAYIVRENCGIKIPITTKDQMVNEFAKAIHTLANNPQKRVKMGKNAKDRIRNEFTWDVAVTKMLKIYDEVINES